jgi:hypothetical protein
METKTFFKHLVAMTKCWNSAERRWQVARSEFLMGPLAGKVENKKIMERASSKSLRASINVGYLFESITRRIRTKAW